MKNMKNTVIGGIAALFLAASAHAGEVKEIEEMKILAVEWREGDSGIAAPFAELVDYYNNGDLNEITAMEIVFPQMTFDFADGLNWIAIEFTGEAMETGAVKVKKIPAGKIYSVMHAGPYQKLGGAIRAAYKSLLADGHIPDDSRPHRLLYWNSPDDNPP
ncbi:MAG: GyrI-like domain-containing protein, partial [Betaproteobacteria bacterium]|nr:GyrI-like domain-containing protein [Betaproteobacteria bacterium]